ncbi:hypothetical protein CDAR_589251 [Caerostris darwini]|uniref:Uncharacterized protein n=1 Tax=Caerostris darwini TaxID=1538125 RepID=A0AAV4T7A0_9ARAC|nr:hypothetical protein CDAR_589251 [Caerostris darwini]
MHCVIRNCFAYIQIRQAKGEDIAGCWQSCTNSFSPPCSNACHWDSWSQSLGHRRERVLGGCANSAQGIPGRKAEGFPEKSHLVYDLTESGATSRHHEERLATRSAFVERFGFRRIKS